MKSQQEHGNTQDLVFNEEKQDIFLASLEGDPCSTD